MRLLAFALCFFASMQVATAHTYQYQLCSMKGSFRLLRQPNGEPAATKLFPELGHGIGVKVGVTRDEHGKEWVQVLKLLQHRGLQLAPEGWALRESVDCPSKRILRGRCLVGC